MLKLDGLTVKLTYENGWLAEASTRGDGEIGEEITHNIPAFENVPFAISYKERLVVTGEAFIHRKDFERLNTTLRDRNGEPYKNARNLAAGSVRSLDPENCKDRCVTFLPSTYWKGWMREKTATAGRNAYISYQSWALVPARIFP